MNKLTDTDFIFLDSYGSKETTALPREKTLTPTTASLQTMMLPSGVFVLVLDNWSGVDPSQEWVDQVKEVTGAAGVMIFSVPITVISD